MRSKDPKVLLARLAVSRQALEWVLYIDSRFAEDGLDGKDGKDGKDGQAGPAGPIGRKLFSRVRSHLLSRLSRQHKGRKARPAHRPIRLAGTVAL